MKIWRVLAAGLVAASPQPDEDEVVEMCGGVPCNRSRNREPQIKTYEPALRVPEMSMRQGMGLTDCVKLWRHQSLLLIGLISQSKLV